MSGGNTVVLSGAESTVELGRLAELEGMHTQWCQSGWKSQSQDLPSVYPLMLLEHLLLSKLCFSHSYDGDNGPEDC